MPDGLSLGLIHVRPGRSAYDQHRSRAVQMAGHGPGWTAVPNPEKRKVGSSILPLTTSSDQGKRPVQDCDPGVFSCWGLSLGPRSKRTIGGSAGTGEHAGSSRSTTSSGRAWRQTAASQCAPCRIFTPATTVGRLCPQRSSLRGDAVNSAGASGWLRSAPGRLNGIRVRRCGEAKRERSARPSARPPRFGSWTCHIREMSPDQHECGQGLIVSCAAVCGSRRLCAAGLWQIRGQVRRGPPSGPRGAMRRPSP